MEDIVLPGFVTDITDRFNEQLIPKEFCKDLIEMMDLVARDPQIYRCAKEDPGYTILNFYKNLAWNLKHQSAGRDNISRSSIIRFGSLWPAYETITTKNIGFKKKFRKDVVRQVKSVHDAIRRNPKYTDGTFSQIPLTADRISDGNYFWHEQINHVMEIAGLNNGNRYKVPAYMIGVLSDLRKETEVKLPEGLLSYCQNPI